MTNPAEADPLALARAYEAGVHQAALVVPHAAPAPTPSYAPDVEARGGEALFRAHVAPAAGQVLDQYARAGQWLQQP